MGTHRYIDPRDQPAPPYEGPRPEPALEAVHVAPLVQAISRGRFFAVERWVADGHPVQFVYPEDRRSSPTSPLQAAIQTGQHDVLLLLLCNGYRTDLERYSALTSALRERRLDLVDLLLRWGADPKRADPDEIVSSYDVDLIERFWRLGVDLGAGGALAGALGFSSSNKPLYGFCKRHAHEDPALQTELNRGLRHAIENDYPRAIALCMWAGADPWARIPEPEDDVEDGEDDDDKWSPYDAAVGRAVNSGAAKHLGVLKVKAGHPRFQSLYDLVYDSCTFDALAEIAPPTDATMLVCRALAGLDDRGFCRRRYESERILERALASGARVTRVSDHAVRGLQRFLRTADSRNARRLVGLLQSSEGVTQELFRRLIHSPTVVERAREIGLLRSDLEQLLADDATSKGVAAAVRRQLKRARPRP